MSVKASRHSTMMANPPDGGGSGGHRVRGYPRRPELELEDELEADSEPMTAPPLPEDPAILAQLRARLEKGLADAKAGIGEDWEAVHA